MRRSFQEIRCQRCGAANLLGEELCERCGTRLMLIVEPSTLRYEEESASAAQHEGQLLERISLLENNLLRFAERLEKGFELLLKQSQIALSDHALVENLINLLDETGGVDRRKLNTLWRAALDGEKNAGQKPDGVEFLRGTIVDDYQGADKDVFAKFIKGGLEFLADGKTTLAKRELERAAALAPANSTLNFVLGLQFFREGKFTLSRTYLQRAHDIQPVSTQVYLLLGIACGDDGEVEQATKLLLEAIEHHGSSFAAHYALGRFQAAEDNWKEALIHFKGALAAKPCAEAHYVMGFTLARLGRLHIALRHVNKAIGLDESYAAAFGLLGFIQEQSGEAKLANKAFATAVALGLTLGSVGRGTKKRPTAAISEEMLLHSFFGAARHRQKRLLTAGDKRLAQLLREDALEQVGFGTLTPAR